MNLGIILICQDRVGTIATPPPEVQCNVQPMDAALDRTRGGHSSAIAVRRRAGLRGGTGGTCPGPPFLKGAPRDWEKKTIITIFNNANVIKVGLISLFSDS